jgi:hypothetical protein
MAAAAVRSSKKNEFRRLLPGASITAADRTVLIDERNRNRDSADV